MPEPAVQVAEPIPTGSATSSASPSAAPGELELLPGLLREERRVVGDEAERVDERVQVRERRRAITRLLTPVLDHGTSTRLATTSAASQRERERDGERARRVDLGLERRRLA